MSKVVLPESGPRAGSLRFFFRRMSLIFAPTRLGSLVMANGRVSRTQFPTS